MMANSEGVCPKCGTPLGISGTCYTCAIQQEEAERALRPKCPSCGEALGNSGICLNCNCKRLEQELNDLRARRNYPTCAECGASMIHGRLTGYVCVANARHDGIVWPQAKR